MIRRIRQQIRHHPIPWYLHPIIVAVLYYPYRYYFTAICIPVEHAADACFLGIQQGLVFYPAICGVLPGTVERLRAKWGRALLGLLGLWLLAEAFIIGVSIGYGQLEFGLSSLDSFTYDIENGEWLFPAATASVLVALFYQTCVIIVNEQRQKAAIERKSAELTQQLDGVAADWYAKQLNPHLLNGLMLIVRKLIYEQASHAYDAYQEVIRILRFYLALRPDTMLIPLTDELQQGQRLCYLKTLEQGTEVCLDWIVAVPEDATIQVPPMLLLMLLKNLLKHGILDDAAHPALFCVKAVGQHLIVDTRNAIQRDAEIEGGNKTGLEQIERTLRRLYGHAFTFNYTRVGDEFFVHLQIPVHSCISKQH